ncbi:hypothetical protein TNCV_5094381 [Trichonephila clavipes]|nr:hypothetical protein TNCV_5094381 [Trichonephila clavipes]
MFRSCGQSEAKPPVFSSQASLLLVYRSTERTSRPCPARDLNPGPVAGKQDTLPLRHLASRQTSKKHYYRT